MRRSAILLAALASACSLLGEQGGSPQGLPHGGTGQFRFLDQAETGVASARALESTTDALDAAMMAGDRLFYATAPVLASPPMIPADLPAGDVFWGAFEPRRIHRGTRIDGARGFLAGPEILRAQETWEGTEVFDPWVVVLPDGRARLYYAAAGGIGVAEAPGVDGAFTRVGSAPIVGGGARRPSVVRGADDRFWMYYEGSGGIHASVSSDGLVFETASPSPIALPFECPPVDAAATPCDLVESPEVGVGMPGAVRVETAARARVRLYFESRREDGSRALYVAGTDDGVSFQRYRIAVLDANDQRMPAPLVIDRRTTLLLTSARVGGASRETRAYRLSVTPASVRFAPLPEMP